MTTVWRPPPRSLADVRDPDGDAFPRDILQGESALVLFAAQWHGRQDAYWIAEADMHGTCVDVQPDRLREMENIYPDGWEFVCADAFAYTETTDRVWDVVTVDCPTGAFQLCADLLHRWCALARTVVVLGSGFDTTVKAPTGWRVSDVRKRSEFSGGVYWTIVVPK